MNSATLTFVAWRAVNSICRVTVVFCRFSATKTAWPWKQMKLVWMGEWTQFDIDYYSATEQTPQTAAPRRTVHGGSRKETRNEWLNCVVALSWLDSSPATHCTCNPSSKYLMFYTVVWNAALTHIHTPFNKTHKHARTLFFFSCPRPRPGPVFVLRPDRRIRPFPLMKLSTELTARHKDVPV